MKLGGDCLTADEEEMLFCTGALWDRAVGWGAGAELPESRGMLWTAPSTRYWQHGRQFNFRYAWRTSCGGFFDGLQPVALLSADDVELKSFTGMNKVALHCGQGEKRQCVLAVPVAATRAWASHRTVGWWPVCAQAGSPLATTAASGQEQVLTEGEGLRTSFICLGCVTVWGRAATSEVTWAGVPSVCPTATWDCCRDCLWLPVAFKNIAAVMFM